ncbi:MAG: energy-coupling factor ABC transporter ATP-binding protein [Elainella sp.]
MLLEFNQVEFTYTGGQAPALRQLSFGLSAGRGYAIIGPNGCGKTTLFQLTNGLHRPQRGQIFWQDRPLRYGRAELNQLRQQVGLVFQDPEQQIIAPTVEQDLAYGLGNLQLPEPEIAARVGQALREFDLLALADWPVQYLSLGQKKRVSIADVMVLRPRLLLLDEPTAYLDPAQTRSLLRQLRQIQTSGTTLVIASHDLEFVNTWADWIFVMHQGRMVAEGQPQQIFSQRQLLDQIGLGIPPSLKLLAAVEEMLRQAGQSDLWVELQQRLSGDGI